MKRPNKASRIQWNLYCEGDSEKIYFERVAYLLNAEAKEKRVHLLCDSCDGGSAKKVVEKAKLKAPIAGNVAVVFDHEGKWDEFKKGIMDAKKHGFSVIYSNISFELWLLQHKSFFNKCVYHSSDYNKFIEKAFGLDDSYRKTREQLKYIASQIDLKDIFRAIENAKRIGIENKKDDYYANWGGRHYYNNPDLSVQIFTEMLLKSMNLM